MKTKNKKTLKSKSSQAGRCSSRTRKHTCGSLRLYTQWFCSSSCTTTATRHRQPAAARNSFILSEIGDAPAVLVRRSGRSRESVQHRALPTVAIAAFHAQPKQPCRTQTAANERSLSDARETPCDKAPTARPLEAARVRCRRPTPPSLLAPAEPRHSSALVVVCAHTRARATPAEAKKFRL